MAFWMRPWSGPICNGLVLTARGSGAPRPLMCSRPGPWLASCRLQEPGRPSSQPWSETWLSAVRPATGSRTMADACAARPWKRCCTLSGSAPAMWLSGKGPRGAERETSSTFRLCIGSLECRCRTRPSRLGGCSRCRRPRPSRLGGPGLSMRTPRACTPRTPQSAWWHGPSAGSRAESGTRPLAS